MFVLCILGWPPDANVKNTRSSPKIFIFFFNTEISYALSFPYYPFKGSAIGPNEMPDASELSLCHLEVIRDFMEILMVKLGPFLYIVGNWSNSTSCIRELRRRIVAYFFGDEILCIPSEDILYSTAALLSKSWLNYKSFFPRYFPQALRYLLKRETCDAVSTCDLCLITFNSFATIWPLFCKSCLNIIILVRNIHRFSYVS